MSNRTRDLLLLFVMAVIVNGVVASLVSVPGYTDAYYYLNGGQFIVEGRGLTEPYRWNYVNSPHTLPAPGFDFWQPLPAFLSAAGIALFGSRTPFDSAQLVFVIASAILPLIAYGVASHVGERRHALLAGLLAVFSGFFVIYWSLPESFTPFALSGAGALAMIGMGSQREQWWPWLLAGLCAGAAHLARADGELLILVGIFVAVLQPGRRWLYAGWLVLGYLAVMSPWFYRNLVTFGSIQPPGSLSVLWLVEYNDLFNYPQNLTPAHFFAAGLPTILKTRWDALAGNLTSFVAVQNLIFLTPLTILGVWRRWRRPWLLPAVLYNAALFAAMTIVFPLPGLRGGYFHSAGALLPATFASGALGLDDALNWMARWRRWLLERSRRIFSAACVGMAALLTAYLVLARVVGLPVTGRIAWNQTDIVYGQIGQTLTELGSPPAERVMSNDPPGFYYFTGRGGMPLPNGGETALLQAARDYQISYVVLDHNVPNSLLNSYLHGPTSSDLVLVHIYGPNSDPVYLYRFVPTP